MNSLFKGKAISIEGGEGSGKGTLIESLKGILGKEVVYTREPGGTKTSEAIRNVIMDFEMEPLTEAMLFASSRSELLNTVVFPALEDSKLVILDRYVHSSYVYQGIARGLGLETVQNINDIATQGWMPQKTIILDLDPKVGLKRIEDNNRDTNRLDKESLNFHTRVRDGYLQMKKLYPEQVEIVDASRSSDEVLEDVLKIIRKLI